MLEFPQGNKLAEGVACDLARAFIQYDAALLVKTCVSPNIYGTGPARKQYESFLKEIQRQMSLERAKKKPSPGGPKQIQRVFAVRSLSRNGPASYGYAVLGLKDVRFVDVEVLLHSGRHVLNRTLVLQLSDSTWRVHPLPTLSPMLSTGLNEEKPSTVLYSSKK
ncbi:MAG: hypothetical protein QM758_28895 [Armatimonas sp.]